MQSAGISTRLSPRATRLWTAAAVAVWFLGVSFCHSTNAADWTTYRNGNARTGSTSEKLVLPLKAEWTYSAPSLPETAWSGPDRRTFEGKDLRQRVKFDDAFHTTIVGNRLYFGSTVDDKVYCLEADTGRPIWSFFTGGPVRLAPTVWNGQVLFGSDDGYAYCLDAKTGRFTWKLRAGPADEWLLARGEMISRWPVRTGVLVDDGIAYFAAGIFPHEDVYLYAVEAATGKTVWKVDNISESDAGRNDLSPQGYLLATDDLLFVPSGRSLPAAFDRTTGKLAHKRTFSWRGDAGGVVGGTRALLADGQLYAAGEHHMLAMNQQTGNVGFGYFYGRQLVVSGDHGYTATGADVQKLHRKDYAAGSLKKRKLDDEIYQLNRKLRTAKGIEAAKIKARIAEAALESVAAAKTGVVWSRETKLDSALTAAGDLVFAGGEGRVEALRESDGKPVWNAEVDGEVRGFAVANERLYVSTTTGKIYSFVSSSATPGIPVAAAEPKENPYPQDNLTAIYERAAADILKRTGITRGFCLVVGAEQGRLAYELAKRSDLEIYGIEPDENKVAAAREILSSVGMYGHRITMHHFDPADIPYSNYFANLIVSDSQLLTGKLPAGAERIARHLKPLGGVAAVGGPLSPTAKSPTQQARDSWLKEMDLAKQSSVKKSGPWTLLTRAALPGAGNWSHQYGEPGNTACSDDRLVKGGLGVLWYGDPGPGKMVNRHEGAVGPLAVNGRLIVQGENSVMAYDAYNGRFLWEHKNPGILRTGVFQNNNPANVVASNDAVFVMMKDKCVELDAATGKLNAAHELPASRAGKSYEWGFVAYREGVLFGTATIREELERRRQRRGKKVLDSTDAIFAIDVKTGKHLWTYEGKSISHRTIALGPEKVYFIDSSITSAQREALLREDKTALQKLKGEAAKRAEDLMKRQDARLAVAVDARTGKKLWEKAVDVTDCSETEKSPTGAGGGMLTLIYANNTLVLCGANANGHYWKQFMSGEFSKRRLVSLSADDGSKLWAKDANYRHRPIVVEDRIIAEPWSFDLYTGVQHTRPHPLTGEQVPWSIIRPGHHCGMLSASPGMLMFRSGYTGFYDLESERGTQHFAGHRLGCWINAIPANGLVMIPEASAGCVCLFSIASTITMEPRTPRRPWTIYSSTGSTTPVKNMRLNLGAPGDRRDARGKVWLAYPRPNPRKTTGLDLKLDLAHKSVKGGGFESLNSQFTQIGNTDSAWLYSSWANGVSSYSLPLLGKEDKPAVYTVTLHFADIDAANKPGDRVFDVKLQGKTVLEKFDVTATARGNRKAVIREIKDVQVTGNLQLELIPRGDGAAKSQMPILSALEVVRSNSATVGR